MGSSYKSIASAPLPLELVSCDSSGLGVSCPVTLRGQPRTERCCTHHSLRARSQHVSDPFPSPAEPRDLAAVAEEALHLSSVRCDGDLNAFMRRFSAALTSELLNYEVDNVVDIVHE